MSERMTEKHVSELETINTGEHDGSLARHLSLVTSDLQVAAV